MIMYWLVKYDPEVGMITREYKDLSAARRVMKREFGSLKYVDIDSILTEDNHISCLSYDYGTYEWQIVGEGDPERERILADIERNYGKDFLESEDMAEFFIDHWNEYECAMDIECYAILNTIFGYDIGSDKARKINNWLYEKFNMTAMDIPEGDDADNLMRVAKWDLGLDLDFSNFNADIEAIR